MGRRNQYLSKHVRETATQGWPEPKEEEFVVQLVRSRGGNTMECKSADGEELLCWLPQKFSKVVWAQRGDFLIVTPSADPDHTGKVAHTIVHILFPEQCSHLRKIGKWPDGFSGAEQAPAQSGGDNGEGAGTPAVAGGDRVVDAVAAGVAGLGLVGGAASSGAAGGAADGGGSEGSDGSDNDDDLFVNRNGMHEDSWEESVEEEEEDEDDDDV
jgi:translation initiation factor IF-1